MKKMIKMFSVILAALFSFMMITDAKVVEKDNYTEDTYIIGYSRFSGKSALTADMAAQAGQSYERIYSYLNMKASDAVQVYLKSELDGVWYTAKTGKPLTEDEVKKLTENLMIFYVDEVEKTFEYKYSGLVDSDSLPKGVTYSNGKFTIPASKFQFSFKSNGNLVEVSTKIDFNKAEYIIGEFESEFRLNPVVSLEIPETILVAQSVEFTVNTTSDDYNGYFFTDYLKFDDYSAVEKVEIKYYDYENSVWKWRSLTNEGNGFKDEINIGDEKTYKVTFKKEANLNVNYELHLYELDDSLVTVTKSIKVNGGTDIKDIITSQANTIKTTYYDKYSEKTIESVVDEYYVNLGAYTGSENPNTLSIEGNDYSANKIGVLSIGRGSYINVPIWKIKDGDVLVALPWLAIDSLPNGATTIKVGGQEIRVYTYGSDAGKSLELYDGNVLYYADGYSYDLSIGEKIEFSSGHGHHALGIDIVSNDENALVNDPDQLIFRKASNGTMGITFPEDGYTYILYPYWKNGPYTEDKTYNLDYKLAIPGKGVIDLEIIFKTVVDPIDIKDIVTNQAETFMNTYYNTGVTTIDDSIYYVNLGTYTGSENPTSLSIGFNSYGTANSTLSVGNNVFIDAPIWKIKDGNVLVALPWLASDSLPSGVTEIRVGGQLIKVNTYDSDEERQLTITNSVAMNTIDGYTNSSTLNAGLINYISGHGQHALGVNFSNDSGFAITTEQIIFRKNNTTGLMGITRPDAEDLYIFYPEYSESAYTEAAAREFDFTLAIPGRGVVDLKISFEKVVD